MAHAGVSCRAQYGINQVILSHQRALVGDTLNATCDIRNEPGLGVLVIWVRETPNQQEVEISSNLVLNDPFVSTGRYSLSHVLLDGKRLVQFQLNITGMYQYYLQAYHLSHTGSCQGDDVRHKSVQRGKIIKILT